MSRGGALPDAPVALVGDAGLDPATTWWDSHCHLDPATADDVVAQASAAGVADLVVVGTDVASSLAAASLAGRHDRLRAVAGVHPHDASGGLEGLEAVLADPAVVAVGECGFDFHYDHSPRDVQREVFAAQVALAHQLGVTLVVHTREAWPETWDVLDGEGVPERTVLHCFTGGPDEARAALDRGCHLSFSGIVTFPSAGDLREAARLCPADRLLVETDSPYLTPAPHRGRTNHPGLVPLVGQAVAAARSVAVEDVAAVTSANAERLFTR